jgi:hypothetical protein
MAHIDDDFLTILRMAMGKQAECMKDVKLQFEDAKGEAAKLRLMGVSVLRADWTKELIYGDCAKVAASKNGVSHAWTKHMAGVVWNK